MDKAEKSRQVRDSAATLESIARNQNSDDAKKSNDNSTPNLESQAATDLEGLANSLTRSTNTHVESSDRASSDQSMNHANTPGHVPGKFAYPSGSKPLEGYTLKRGIGVGGFGEVYFALSDAGKEVALKRIQRNLDIELRVVRQCLNLKHINLISLWDIKTNLAGESWVVMEYVPGPSLRDLVEAYPKGMPEDQIRLWFCSTAAGTSYLHDQGIVHRDLKPANIFYDEDQQVIKIGDYGLSKFISCSRRSGQTETVGTFHYMAPEVGKGIYGKEIDVYALGIVLYELITGDVPFDGESTQEIIMKHLTADPNLDVIPIKFREPIRKAMYKDPEQRFRNVNEMLEALPWPTNEKVIVATPTAARVASVAANTSTTANGSMLINEIDLSLVDKSGIAFGPLKESSPGTNKSVEPIQFIETNRVAGTAAVTVAGAPEEPIAKAVQSGWAGVATWWNNASVSTPLKIFLLAIAGVVVIQNSEWMLPGALALGLVYLIYYGVRMWLLMPQEEKPILAEAVSTSAAPVEAKRSKQEINQLRQSHVRRFLSERVGTDRLAELTGSLLVSAIACMIFNLLGMAIGGSIIQGNIGSWAILAWTTLTSIVACWSLLITSKLWEHREGDGWLRRLSMAGIGLFVGIASYSAGVLFHVDFSLLTSGSEFALLSPENSLMKGLPNLFAFLVFFTTLFASLRWWRQVDPVRKTRLSIWNVGLCLVLAAVLGNLLAFAPIWSCVLAAVISSAAQLSAPWLHPEQQRSISMNSFADTVRL